MQRYNKYSQYLKETFQERVHKVSVDAAFSCPNKDGAFSREGCIYCDNKAFSFNSNNPIKSVESQIKDGMEFAKRRYGVRKFIVYFQAHTNTYAPLGILNQEYDKVRSFDDVVGISIGTRPDCVDKDILDLIKSYSGDYDVWIEYGLQSIHDTTLQFINRGHDYSAFLKAVKLTRQRDIKICAHVIIGLPNETKEQIVQTAKELARLRIDAVKIHPLHIVKNTKLQQLHELKQYRPLELNEFVNMSIEFLENLWPATVIQRIGADCPKGLLVAPSWMLNKKNVLSQIEKKLEEKDSWQGKKYSPTVKNVGAASRPRKEILWQSPLTRSI